MTATTGQTSLSTINLILAEGVDNTFSFVYSTTVAAVTTPVDMSSGWTVAAQIRTDDLTTVLLDLTALTTLGSAGQIDIVIPAVSADTTAIRGADRGVWDLKLTHAGNVLRFCSGVVTISHGVTRAS